eukprot:7619573-Pyramimonas_sp.AAC.1
MRSGDGLRSEVAVASPDCSGSVFWGILKFYKPVDIDLLLARCRQHSFPMPIARVCYSAYRSPFAR